MDAYQVTYSKQADKDISKLQKHLLIKLRKWAKSVKENGILETRKIKGYHDEPLKGNRKGQRSIRLSKGYRAFYTEYDNGSIELNYIEVDEVNKHDY